MQKGIRLPSFTKKEKGVGKEEGEPLTELLSLPPAPGTPAHSPKLRIEARPWLLAFPSSQNVLAPWVSLLEVVRDILCFMF